jgi:hypothetical protein
VQWIDRNRDHQIVLKPENGGLIVPIFNTDTIDRPAKLK